MGFFISKKQKQAMKERRRKKILAEKGLLPVVAESNNIPVDSTSTNKRRRSESDHDANETVVAPTSGSDDKQEEVATPRKGHSSKPLVVTIPSNLPPRDAKKFRKDKRRQARLDGHDNVVFITEHEEAEQQAKKPKRSFPNLNEVLQREKKSQQEAAVQQAQDDLSDEYKARYVALDCEMVGIGSEGRQSALARVSIVNWNGETLLDTFVQVPTKVTDFRTFVSGVKPKHISDATAMNESTCRKTVAALIKDKIVVGHALKNDWHALMLQHPASMVRDTAHYRPFQRLGNNKWRPRKLRDLAFEHCGMVIQEAGQSHDSVDDALAVMKLFQTVHVAWEKELELKAKKKSSR
jgi:RNA exonuclease 4